MFFGKANAFAWQHIASTGLNSNQLRKYARSVEGKWDAASVTALGHNGASLTEDPFEVLYLADENFAIIAHQGEDLSTIASSMKDAIERFLGMDGKRIESRAADHGAYGLAN